MKQTIKSLSSLAIPVVLGVLASGCGSFITTPPDKLDPRPNGFLRISLSPDTVNVSEAAPANQYKNYRRDIYHGLVKNSGGNIVNDPAAELKFKELRLRCYPPKPGGINNTGMVLAAIIFPPLMWYKEHCNFPYMIDYRITNRYNEVVLKRFMTTKVKGYAQCENTATLLNDEGKFVSENVVRMVINDLYGNSKALTLAASEARNRKAKLVREAREREELKKRREAARRAAKIREQKEREQLWQSMSAEAAKAVANRDFRKAAAILANAKLQGLGGNEPEKRLREIYKLASKLKPKPAETQKIQPVTVDSANCWALVVGVSKYRNSGKNELDNLEFADDDAEDFRKILIKQGWKDNRIKFLTDKDATKKNIEEALAGWLTKVNSNDLLVLFWSGHGYPDPGDTRRVYFACYDTELNKPYTGWRMDKVIDFIKERNPRNVLVMVDSCHAGKLITRSSEKGISVRPYLSQLQERKKIPPGWIYFVSAAPDRKSIENRAWSNGAFSYCLVNGLSGEADADRDGEVTMLELKSYMASAMPEETLKVLGAARHPIIISNSADHDIWRLSLSPTRKP